MKNQELTIILRFCFIFVISFHWNIILIIMLHETLHLRNLLFLHLQYELQDCENSVVRELDSNIHVISKV